MEIEAEKGTLVQTLSEKRAALATAEFDALAGDELRQAVSLFRAWQNLTFSQKKQVIHLLTERVEWDYHTRRITVRTAV